MRNYVNKSDLDNNFENLFFEEAQSEEVSFLHESSPSFSYNINQSLDLSEIFQDDQIKNDLFEKSQKKEENTKKIFKVTYPEKISLFTYIENESDEESLNSEISKLKMKKFNKKRRRRENRDNIRKKIKCGFLNGNLIKNLNKKLKSIGSRLFFDKFPQHFIGDIGKESNKKVLNLSLNELFEKKELYKEKEYSYYNHNLKVVRNEDVQNNYSMRQIMNMKYSKLYEYYINSEEFVDEINRLKKKGMNDDYIKNYIYLAKHFLEFFQN